MKKKKLIKPNGFTLVEVTLVITIILTLVVSLTVGIDAYKKASEQARCIIQANKLGKIFLSHASSHGVFETSSPAQEIEDTFNSIGKGKVRVRTINLAHEQTAVLAIPLTPDAYGITCPSLNRYGFSEDPTYYSVVEINGPIPGRPTDMARIVNTSNFSLFLRCEPSYYGAPWTSEDGYLDQSMGNGYHLNKLVKAPIEIQ